MKILKLQAENPQQQKSVFSLLGPIPMYHTHRYKSLFLISQPMTLSVDEGDAFLDL